MMNVKVIRREMIKPSSPTPLHLEKFRISLLDQFAPPSYTPLILFYGQPLVISSNTDNNFDLIKLLKQSISETLTLFYPLAGRLIKEENYVHCNDQGAEFLESQVNAPIAAFVSNPDMQFLEHFLPRKCQMLESDSEPQLAIQANLFSCGGLAIGICLSHKLSDGATLGCFVKCWAATARKIYYTNTTKSSSSSSILVYDQYPSFEGPDIFPPIKKACPIILSPPREGETKATVTRRFVFDKSAISAIKAKLSSTMSKDDKKKAPTRVEAVTALLWKCLISVKAQNRRESVASILVFPVNVRGRLKMDPPLTDWSFGNICKSVMVAPPPAEDPELSELVRQLREATAKIDAEYSKRRDLYQGILVLHEPFTRIFAEDAREKELCTLSSWCRFPLYETDLGWGKPIWVSSYNFCPTNELIILMDTRDGDGVEAAVSLVQQDILSFEKHPLLLPFASSSTTTIAATNSNKVPDTSKL